MRDETALLSQSIPSRSGPWLGSMSLSILCIHVILPLLVGGFIYILFRSQTFLMFRWFRFLGVDALIHQSRVHLGPYSHTIPDFIIFSVPDAVWVYSLTVVMGTLWHDASLTVKLFWMSIAPLLGIGGELGQYFGIVPGTFDPYDLLACSFATLAAFSLTNRKEVFTK